MNKEASVDHKFFTKDLDNNLDSLSKELLLRYDKIKKAELFGVMPLKDQEIWKESNSVSTMKWREYNVFQFHIEEIYNLYTAVSEMTKDACEWYGLDFKKNKYMIQGWFNINYANEGKLGWHLHKNQGSPLFHGYYCVSAEPSKTDYLIFDNQISINNVNNRALLSESGHLHQMGDWEWSGPRITVAYDVRPLENLKKEGMQHEQHWLPLL